MARAPGRGTRCSSGRAGRILAVCSYPPPPARTAAWSKRSLEPVEVVRVLACGNPYGHPTPNAPWAHLLTTHCSRLTTHDSRLTLQVPLVPRAHLRRRGCDVARGSAVLAQDGRGADGAATQRLGAAYDAPPCRGAARQGLTLTPTLTLTLTLLLLLLLVLLGTPAQVEGLAARRRPTRTPAAPPPFAHGHSAAEQHERAVGAVPCPRPSALRLAPRLPRAVWSRGGPAHLTRCLPHVPPILTQALTLSLTLTLTTDH